ncbi:trafficking protein particle complex subunit 10 [Schizophyllum amplum]|uniref:Trafficking protein particle complex subunit 10 n=1 Tax=Schizophyllum amplum TaxID=97359 RepID=A0A550CAP1_9AGAR|nr:trafficking protein particle complex subunit 10 [Auriculariopsis ampla]
MASRAPSQKVGVSFAGPPLLLASGTWKQITASLEAQLPLRNIHWKPAARSSIRTIQELYVNFMPLGTLRDENTSQVPVTVLDRPLLHMFFIACEDADLELYRTSVKKQIKDWHTSIVNRKNQEWLIVQVVKPEAKPVTGNFFAIKGSVYDKIRADFNTDKRDRCVQLSWSATSADNPATWAEAVNKIKEGLVSAFDLVLQQREEEVKRSEGQRLMPGWNFCTFFVLKETLATSFEGIGLYEDALAQYDELELLFYGVLKDKNLSWFGTLISPAPNDDSASLLSISKKPYKDLILANTISVFDFRIYLLARQCELLANLGRLNEVSHKTSAFLSAFGRRLREVQNTLPQYFIESWTYSSALSVVAQCDSWLAAFRVESPKVAALNAGKGELLELARIQLDNIGINAGHLPNKPPFCNAYQGPVSTTTESPLKISNRDVLYAISDKDHFHELYVSTTKLAIDMYAKAGRRKFALKLHGSLAALDVHRQRLSTALTTFTSLPAHYSPHHWTSLEFFVLSRALDTHAALDQQHDRDWIHTLLAFLNAYVTTMGKELLMDQADSERYLVGLIEALQKAAVELDQQLEYTDHPALTLTAENEAVPSGNKDGNNLNIIVTNHLPCPLPVTEIRVNLVGRDSERLTFTAQTDSLAPGKTQLTTFSPIPLHGTFALDTSEAYISKLVLQRTHRKSSSSVKVLRSARDVTLVHIPHDLLALDLRVRQPDLIQLGRRSILVALSTGRNHLSRAMVRLSSQNVQHEHAKAVLASGSPPANIEAIDEGFTLLDVDPDCTVLIEVPHTGTPSARIMQVAIKVEYDVQDDPETTRTLLLSRSVLTSLPVAIHVKDHFRGNKLFSRFVVETTTHQHIRISDAQLELLDPAESARVSVCSRKARVVTVTPSQPASFLFCLQSNGGPAVLESLRFSIKYRILREEVQALLDESVRSALGNDISDLPTRVTLLANLTKALESDTKWIQKYSITGELDVPSADNESVDPVLQLLRANRHSYPPKGKWKELAIPVDVPTMDIVAAAGLRVTSNPAAAEDASEESPFYAGQPLSALITVRTSFHWSDKPRDSDRQYTLRFDLEEMTQDWLVSGRKRGDFAAEDNGEFSFPVTLIALHHGELPLPKVIITPLPVAGEMTMGSLALPSLRTHQEHDAETLLVLPRGGRSTFVLGSS